MHKMSWFFDPIEQNGSRSCKLHSCNEEVRSGVSYSRVRNVEIYSLSGAAE